MKDSAIQWTDHTFNPWEGCTKVAPECKNCYAETLVDHRFRRVKWGKGQPRRRTSEATWKQPLRWNEKPMVCGGCGKSFNFGYEVGQGCPALCGGVLHRARVFCLSLGDWLDEEVSIEWLADLLALIHATPNLDWQLLTKGPQNFVVQVLAAGMILMGYRDKQKSDLPEALAEVTEDVIESVLGWSKGETFPSNIWIGVSAGADQKAALEIPAKIHFLSCEPMLHPLDPKHAAGFDWIIFGGESGKNARRLDVDWIEDGISFCRLHGIAPFVKQLGAKPHIADASHPHGWEGNNVDWENTGRIYLRDSHGGDMSEWPEDLRVREFPVTGENAERGMRNAGMAEVTR